MGLPVLVCVCMRVCVHVVLPDSSQSDSHSDPEDHRPGFSMPSISQNASAADDSKQDDADKFSMYNRVSQRLMVRHHHMPDHCVAPA